MGVKVDFKTIKNDFPDMHQSIKGIDSKRVNVGVTGENAWLAGIHEYGCRIKVTEKMRAWLHANGLHIKNETTEIVIPERSFLRNGFDDCHEDIIRKAERLIPVVLDGNMPSGIFLEEVGALLLTHIKKYAEELNKPANHPFTTERKGSENPLVNTGGMINSISCEVE